MSRITAEETVVVKPTNNIYTVLAVAATVALVTALVIIFLRANSLFPPDGLLG